MPSENDYKTIKCTCTPRDIGNGKVWEATACADQNDYLWYTYVVDDFLGEGSDCDHGGYGDQEREYRVLKPNISHCHDILRLQQPLHEDDILDGFEYHITLVLKNTKDPRDLQVILQELQHLCEKEDRVFAEKNIHHWAKFVVSAFEKHTSSKERLLLLSVLYGILLDRCSGGHEARKGLELDKMFLDHIREAISRTSHDLTPWSKHFCLETGKEVLKRLKEYNWLYFVLYFPYLFQNVEEIISFKAQLGEEVDTIPFQDVFDKIMPITLTEGLLAILQEIPDTPGFNPTAKELQQLYDEIRGGATLFVGNRDETTRQN